MYDQKRLETAFVIVAQARSGSTLLAHALNAHDDIICHDEIFSSNWVQGYRTGFKLGGSEEFARKLLAEREADPEKFLFERVFVDNGKFNGFKVVYSDLNTKTPAATFLREFLKESRVRVFHLRRVNMLRCFVSFLRMKDFGVVHSDNSKPTDQKLVIDVPHFTRFVVSQDANSDLINRSMNVAAQPRYEMMPQGYRACLQALGVGMKPFEQLLTKMAPDSLSDAVENYEEVAPFDFPRPVGFVKYTN